MNGITISQATLLTLSTAFGALGMFFLYYSCCMSAPVGGYALLFLGLATAISLFAGKSEEHA